MCQVCSFGRPGNAPGARCRLVQRNAQHLLGHGEAECLGARHGSVRYPGNFDLRRVCLLSSVLGVHPEACLLVSGALVGDVTRLPVRYTICLKVGSF
jgi:hypothetical protein